MVSKLWLSGVLMKQSAEDFLKESAEKKKKMDSHKEKNTCFGECLEAEMKHWRTNHEDTL